MDSNQNAGLQTESELLEQLLGNKRLTRRVIEAFPQDQLFEYAPAGMRPFADLVGEMLRFGSPLIRGVATGNWGEYPEIDLPASKEELLDMWDESVATITGLWPDITVGRFQARQRIFNTFETTGLGGIIYALENEIHHRAQAYVYLRLLGIEPPAFYIR